MDSAPVMMATGLACPRGAVCATPGAAALTVTAAVAAVRAARTAPARARGVSIPVPLLTGTCRPVGRQASAFRSYKRLPPALEGGKSALSSASSSECATKRIIASITLLLVGESDRNDHYGCVRLSCPVCQPLVF